MLDGDWAQGEDRTWVLRSGTWYVVWDNPQAPETDRAYELAPPELAAVLSDFQARLRTANDQIAESDAQAIAQSAAQSAAPLGGEVVPPAPRSPEP